MTKASPPTPTGAQLWIYRHRTVIRVIAIVSLLIVVSLAIANLLAGEGVARVFGSLASGGGFVVMLICARQVEHLVERPGKGRRNAQ